MSKLTENLVVRYAIWKCHNGKCYYSKEPIEFREVDLDHIIPLRLGDSPEELNDVLRDLNINPLSFQLDSIYNIVPCKPIHNKEKNGELFFKERALIPLQKAQKLAPKIIEEIEKFKTRKNLNQSLIDVKVFLESQKDSVENIFDFLADEDLSVFKERKETKDYPFGRHYLNSTENIRLVGTLPGFESQGYCSIEFKSLKVRGCKINFDHAEIMNKLFLGINSEPSLRLRKFIGVPIDEKKQNYYIHLGNNTIILNLGEIEQLCKIIDDFADLYLSDLIKIEENLGTSFFEPAKTKGGFRLVKVNRNLWYWLIKFVNEFDVDKGNSDWHIFDSSPGMIKVFTTKENEKLDRGYHVILYPEQEDFFTYQSFLKPDDEMWIIWEPLRDFFSKETLEAFNDREKWNALFSYNWLVNELIPKVIDHYTRKNKSKNSIVISDLILYKFSKGQNTIKDFVFPYLSEKQQINIYRIRTVQQLLNLAEELQYFYYGLNRDLFFKLEEIQGIYSGLYTCLKYTPQNDLNYITGNLQFVKSEKLDDILNEIELFKNNLKEGIIYSFTIDLVLRCIAVTLRDFKTRLNSNQINSIAINLEPLFRIKRLDDLIRKYA